MDQQGGCGRKANQRGTVREKSGVSLLCFGRAEMVFEISFDRTNSTSAVSRRRHGLSPGTRFTDVLKSSVKRGAMRAGGGPYRQSSCEQRTSKAETLLAMSCVSSLR